jgi:SNF2 family DNA or RNA helicase
VTRYIEATDEDGGRIAWGTSDVYSPSECSEVKTPPLPVFCRSPMRESYGRRLLDDTSDGSTENDSGDESEESVMLVTMKSSKGWVIDEDDFESDLDSTVSETDAKGDDATSDEEKDSDVAGAFSELVLEGHDLSENILKSSAQQASLEAVDVHDSDAEHISTSERRVINDDESSVESANVTSDYDADNNDGHSENGAVANSKSLIGNAFSELILDDDADKTSSKHNNDQFDTHTINDEDSQSNNEQDDDYSILEIEGCGCWTYNKPTGDLYLPASSGKWPRIRLPFSIYQKLYQHQRIGIQWMASLHRNTIKGGILADDMGMGKTMQTLVYLGSMMRAESIHNALIVCPKSVVSSWEREANLVFKDIVPKCTVCAVTSDVGKGKRMQLFTEAFCR